MITLAIQTKYYPATNYKGARIKAFTQASPSHSVWISNPMNSDGALAHWRAAQALLDKYQWPNGEYTIASTKDGYIFVRSNSEQFQHVRKA